MKSGDSMSALSKRKQNGDTMVMIPERKESSDSNLLVAGPSRVLSTTADKYKCDTKPSLSVNENGRSQECKARRAMSAANELKNEQKMDSSETGRLKDKSAESRGVGCQARADKQILTENRGRGIGRGRGRGRGCETSSVLQKTRNAARVGNVKSAESQIGPSAASEEARRTNTIPVQAPESKSFIQNDFQGF